MKGRLEVEVIGGGGGVVVGEDVYGVRDMGGGEGDEEEEVVEE